MTYQYRNDNVEGYIYLVEAIGYHGWLPGCVLKRCKIGLTRNVERRLSEFASNQPPCDILLIKAIYVEDMAEVEGTLHTQYKSANVQLIKSREWFDLYPWQVQVIKAKMSALSASEKPRIKLQYIAALALIIGGLSMGSADYLRNQIQTNQRIEVKK